MDPPPGPPQVAASLVLAVLQNSPVGQTRRGLSIREPPGIQGPRNQSAQLHKVKWAPRVTVKPWYYIRRPLLTKGEARG